MISQTFLAIFAVAVGVLCGRKFWTFRIVVGVYSFIFGLLALALTAFTSLNYATERAADDKAHFAALGFAVVLFSFAVTLMLLGIGLARGREQARFIAVRFFPAVGILLLANQRWKGLGFLPALNAFVFESSPFLAAGMLCRKSIAGTFARK